ncbi:MAG: zinc-binding dehydrogenase [Rhodospirillales bacterium]
MDFNTAGGLMLVYGTSLHALQNKAKLKSGETLLVLGAAGGVGLAAVELGHAMGARVIAAASTDEKLALAKAHGAELGHQLHHRRPQIRTETPGPPGRGRRLRPGRRRPSPNPPSAAWAGAAACW